MVCGSHLNKAVTKESTLYLQRNTVSVTCGYLQFLIFKKNIHNSFRNEDYEM